MDRHVHTGELVLVLDAETDRLLDGEAQDPGDDEGVDQDTEGCDRLHRELLEAAAEEQTRLGCEEAEVQRSDDTTDEVDADNVERVVVAELPLELDREGADDTGDKTKQERPAGGQERTRGGDCDETGDGTRGGADRRGLAVLELLDDQPTDDGGSGCTERVDDDDASERN